VKYFFVLIFLVCFAWLDTNIGYTNASPVWTHITFQFQHAGVVHLLVNSFSFVGIFRLLERFVNRWLLAASIIIAGFTASFLSMYKTPTVGASAMIYAMIGMFLFLLARCSDIRVRDKRRFAVFIAGILVCLSISALKVNSNFLLHLSALIFGVLTGIVAGAVRRKGRR
jgi:membrane associated rhomboid family serine protease